MSLDLLQMKSFQQVHLICYDRGFKYQPIDNLPVFNNQEDAEEYLKYNSTRLQDINFYDDPIVIIREETHSVAVKELTKI